MSERSYHGATSRSTIDLVQQWFGTGQRISVSGDYSEQALQQG